jgi:hypothetical protein
MRCAESIDDETLQAMLLAAADGLSLRGVNMKSKLCTALAAAGCALALGVGAAKADTITTFDVSAIIDPLVCVNNCTLGGNIVTNTSNGLIVSANVTMTGLPFIGPFTDFGLSPISTLDALTLISINDALFNRLDLYLPGF